MSHTHKKKNLTNPLSSRGFGRSTASDKTFGLQVKPQEMDQQGTLLRFFSSLATYVCSFVLSSFDNSQWDPKPCLIRAKLSTLSFTLVLA